MIIILELMKFFLGLTETCAGTFVSLPNSLSMLGTVGPPVPNIDVRLESVPEMSYDALADQPQGEVCVRGKTLFSGYYKREDLTNEVLVDGWFHTGLLSLACQLVLQVLRLSYRFKLSFNRKHGKQTVRYSGIPSLCFFLLIELFLVVVMVMMKSNQFLIGTLPFLASQKTKLLANVSLIIHH